MAEIIKFKDGIVQNPTHFDITDVGGNTKAVVPNFGNVIQPASGYDAATFNQLSRQTTKTVKDTSSQTNQYTASLTNMTLQDLTDDFKLILVPNSTNIGASNISLESLGNIAIKKNGDDDLEAGDLIQNQEAILNYNTNFNCFQLLNPQSTAKEVKDSRSAENGKTYNNLPERLDGIDSSLAENANQISSMIINVLYPPSPLTPAKGDGSTDDTAAIQAIIEYVYSRSGGTIFFPKGHYVISSTLRIKTNIILKGDGIESTILKTNGITAIKGAYNVKFTQIKDIFLLATSYATDTVGIEYNEDSGGSQNLIQNVVITDFEKGISARDSWFDNSVKQVRINNAKNAIYLQYKSGGSTINNTFDNIYIDKPKSHPIILGSCRRIVFNNPSIDLTTFPTAVQTSTNVEVIFIGGNFEASELTSGQSIVEILSSSTATFIGTRLAPHTAQSNSYGFNVTGVDSRVVLINCICDKIPNITQVRTAYKDRQVIVNLSPQIDNFVNSSGSAGGNMYKNLLAYETKQSIEVDLSEGSIDFPVIFSTQIMSLISANIVYTEATSADTGVTVDLKNSVYTYASATTEQNKALFSTTPMIVSRNQISANEPLRIACVGGKAGSGKCVVELLYWTEQ